MPNLTDAAIRHALKRVELIQKQENLDDGEGCDTGRLVPARPPVRIEHLGDLTQPAAKPSGRRELVLGGGLLDA